MGSQWDGWRGKEIVGSASNFYQGRLDVKYIPAGRLGILVEMYHSVGWLPGLFRLEGYRRKLQEICLGWVEDEILPDGWVGKRSGEEESSSRRKELSRDTRQGGDTTWLDGDKGCSY